MGISLAMAAQLIVAMVVVLLGLPPLVLAELNMNN